MVRGCGGQPGMKRSTGSAPVTPSWTSSWPMKGPPEIAQAPTAITIFGAGTASYVDWSARRMFSEWAPVTSSPSAWRGEATNWTPKRARSQPTEFSTLVSSSQPLQPPAETWRSLRDRPKIRRVSSRRGNGRGRLRGRR